MIDASILIAGGQGPAGPPGATGPAGPAGPAGTIVSNFKPALLALSPTRLYVLDNPGNGTTELDLGSDAQNGTWSPSATNKQIRSLVLGDSNKAAAFDGSSSYLIVPTTGLPTTGAWSCGMVVVSQRFAGTSSGDTLWAFGNSAGPSRYSLFLTSTVFGIGAPGGGFSQVNVNSGDYPSYGMRPTLLTAVSNGTTLTLYANVFQATTLAASTPTLTNAFVGCDMSNLRPSLMLAQYWFMIKGTALTLAQITDLYLALLGS